MTSIYYDISSAINPAVFFNNILAYNSNYAKDAHTLYTTVRYAPENIKAHPDFRGKLGAVLVELLQNRITTKHKRYYGGFRLHNSDYVKLIHKCFGYINREHINAVIDLATAYKNNFYSSSKKYLAHILTDAVSPNDDRILNILNAFKKNLEVSTFNELMTKIDGGKDNPKVKAILKNTKLFGFSDFDKTKFDTDPNERKRIVKEVAKTVTLLKRLPFCVTFTLEDIKNIPPVTRFDFLQYALRYELKYANWGYSGYNLERWVKRAKQRAKESYFSISKIEVEDMKEALFAISMQKNEELTTWINKYSYYLSRLAKT